MSDPYPQPYPPQPDPQGHPPTQPYPVSAQYPAQPYPPQQYPAPGYGGYPPGPPAYALPPGVQFASWGARFGAYLVDSVLLFACLLPVLPCIALLEVSVDPVTDRPAPWAIAVTVAVVVAGLIAWLWNYCWRMGSKGQSWGKQLVGIHLVRAADLRPPGGLVALGRYLTRSFIGNITCGIYTLLTVLWPLWDDRKQTLDDKIFSTVVVRFPGRVRF